MQSSRREAENGHASWTQGVRFRSIARAAASVYLWIVLCSSMHLHVIAGGTAADAGSHLQIVVALFILVAVTRFEEYASPVLAHAVPLAVLCAQCLAALSTFALISNRQERLALTFGCGPMAPPAFVAVGVVNGFVTAGLPSMRRKLLVLYAPLSIATRYWLKAATASVRRLA